MSKFNSEIKKIGVFCSGGDAPGMNAAIRSVVRSSIYHGLEVTGIVSGYQGILDEKFQPMQLRAVANIIQRGGTILKTARCADFHKKEIRAKAVDHLKKEKIDGLICIGGDGSFTGAHYLWTEHQFPVIGVPGTIDNDINGTDYTIGFDTAVNTALDAIDRIRDTAASHDRLFIVEVMGRNSGFIAASVGLAGGAEEIFTPDINVTVEKAVEKIKSGVQKGKMSSIIVAAEGQKPGRAYDLAEQIRKRTGLEAKVCILGHVQRGGSPTAADRILASRMGAFAVDSLLQKNCDSMTAINGEKLSLVEFDTAVNIERKLSKDLLNLAQILSL